MPSSDRPTNRACAPWLPAVIGQQSENCQKRRHEAALNYPSDDKQPAASSFTPVREGAGVFPATEWSTIHEAATSDPDRALAALERLCRKYWGPVYAFMRQRGHTSHEAEDLTQCFFVYLLEKQAVRKAAPEKGRFRSFLLASAKNFLINEWDKKRRLKRGGHFDFIAFDLYEAQCKGYEPIENLTPEHAFERRWAAQLVRIVLAQVEEEYAAEDNGALFARLEAGLTAEVSPGDCGTWAQALGMSEGAVRVALHRLRRRFGELLRREIARTVNDPAEVDDEIRQLFSALSQ